MDLFYITSTNYDLTLGIANALDYVATTLPDVAPGVTASDFGTGTSTIVSSLLNLTTASQYGWAFSFSPEASTKIQVPVDLTATGDTSVSILVSLNDTSVKEVLFTFLATQVNITIQSGGFSTSSAFSYDPYASAFDIYIEENDLVGTFSVGFTRAGVLTPAASTLSASLVTASSNPNTLRLSIESAASDIRFRGVNASSSATLYTSSFNFIHNLPITFLGVSTTVVNFIETEHGPLVKEWGDYTPAMIEDVSVLLNGLPYAIIGVNPYLGQIFVDPPIPKVLTGTITVEVDYKHMAHATFPMALNVPGLVLNQYSRPPGRNTTSPTITGGSTYKVPHEYRVILGPSTPTVQPRSTGYRFLGVEKGYSAVLNSPESLLLNRGPGGSFTRPTATLAESYSIRAESSVDWQIEGSITDEGGILATGASSYIYEEVSLQPDSAATVTSLFFPQGGDFDGVWSGMGLGFQQESGMYLMGLLTIDGVQHLGVAVGNNLSKEASWQMVGTREALLDTPTLLTVNTDEIPSLFSAGSRFRVATGGQAGVYTISSREDFEGTSSISFSPAVPLDPNLWGNNPVSLIPEFLWEDQRVFLLAQVSGTAVSITASSAMTVTDALTVRRSPFPLFSEWDSGRVFSGNLSAFATPTQKILLTVFESSPVSDPFYSRRSAIDVDFSSLEEQGWFYRFADSINGSSKAEIARYDVTFSNGSVLVTDLAFQSVSQGWDSFKALEVHDRKRQVEVYALVYEESGTRELVSTPRAILSPTSIWSGSLSPQVRPDTIVFSKSTGDTGEYTEQLAGGNRSNTDRTLRFEIAGTATDGFEFFIDSGASLKDVSVILSAGTVSLGSTNTVVDSASLDWEGDVYHAFIVLIEGTTVELLVDGSSVLTEPLASFSASTTTTKTGVRLFGTGVGEVSVKWLNAFEQLPTTATYHRTFGIKVADTGDFDEDWVLPLSAASTLNNSDLSKPVQAVEWDAGLESVRIHLDPSYGMVMSLPSISALGPLFTPDFATQNTNPSRGFCSIEYRRLPFDPTAVGSVSFSTGAGNLLDIDSMEYQIQQDPLSRPQTTRFMVLNRVNIIQSGEYNIDTTPEVVVLTAQGRTLSLREIHMNASLVYQVVDEGTVRTDFTFDKSTQTITMDEELTSPLVQVYFVPARPVTVSYLQAQPESFTNLFERTPPFVWSQTENLARVLLYGVGYDGQATEISSDTGANPLAVQGAGTSPALYGSVQSFEYPDRGTTGALALAFDDLIEFELTIP